MLEVQFLQLLLIKGTYNPLARYQASIRYPIRNVGAVDDTDECAKVAWHACMFVAMVSG
jgi:hypothetical protein